MVLLVTDPSVEESLIAERKATGADRYDEVWDGVYVMSPLANDEHQEIATALSAVFYFLIGRSRRGQVRAGVNVSDRERGWKKNYRCPDVAVFLRGNPATNCGTHWFGGPDFGVEIASRGDRSREKLEFYSTVGVRELLLVDRNPWALEFYRLEQGVLTLVAKSTLRRSAILDSTVLPLSFRLVKGESRPEIEITHSDGKQRWLV